uniref:Succinate dehydrogenase [ubiquinone] cytochrome b small subunit n=1 Tax=Bionectria ochroleuca TaxID=29856 RepID=A0A0B7K5A7_BIOOC
MASFARPSLLRQTAMASRCTAISSVATRAAIARPAVVAAFHTSSKRPAFLPPGPLNDPAFVPEPNSAHGSYHWATERLLAASLVPLTIAPFAAGSLNPFTDAILCGAVLLHSHMGFQQVAFWWALNLATVTVGVGLYEFETNDVGVTEAIKRIWKA